MDLEAGAENAVPDLPPHPSVPVGTKRTDSSGIVWRAGVDAWERVPERHGMGLLLNGRRAGIFRAVALVSVLAVIFLVPLVEAWWLRVLVFALCGVPFFLAVGVTRWAIARDSRDRVDEQRSP
ncbi:hypothetical protein [Pseudoclavibacter sp. VKM Ac-2867]|uniref:hypothetical protein n=1 Tax=Pseudoclavibacter sp. VKM Ac-2867 TaxID=2783829 RepID=UPI00188C835C|nr:hypothetical protein [Pseudoclavibacter sp. VKM Ac-2867]MBF4458129.1 hypothetical protein [Pseudoclavibacter sp. VKM Ac-2867]